VNPARVKSMLTLPDGPLTPFTPVPPFRLRDVSLMVTLEGPPPANAPPQQGCMPEPIGC